MYNMFINLVVIVVFSSSLVIDKFNLENNFYLNVNKCVEYGLGWKYGKFYVF